MSAFAVVTSLAAFVVAATSMWYAYGAHERISGHLTAHVEILAPLYTLPHRHEEPTP